MLMFCFRRFFVGDCRGSKLCISKIRDRLSRDINHSAAFLLWVSTIMSCTAHAYFTLCDITREIPTRVCLKALTYSYNHRMDHGRPVGVTARLQAARLRSHGSIPDRGKNFFLLSEGSRPALVPTQSSTQWITEGRRGYFFEGKRPRHEPDHLHHLVPSLRMFVAVPPLLRVPS
jgi:hypothetical protein